MNGITKGKNKTIKIIIGVAILGAAVYFVPKLLKRNGNGSAGVPAIIPSTPIASSSPIVGGGGGLGYMQSSETGSISPYSPSLQTAFRARSRAALTPGRQKVLI